MTLLMQVAVEYGTLTARDAFLGLQRRIAELGVGTLLLVAVGIAFLALLTLRR
jgi:hypothetical protein